MPEPRIGLLHRLAAVAVGALARPVEAAASSVLDITIFVVIGLVGYVFALLGVSILLGPRLGLGPTLLVIGGVHLVVGIAGVIYRVRQRREGTDPRTERAGSELEQPSSAGVS